MTFKPNFTINNNILTALVEIEKIKDKIKNYQITPTIIKTLRESVKLQSIHYSTMIEGNRLT